MLFLEAARGLLSLAAWFAARHIYIISGRHMVTYKGA